ncbi:MAG: hypothetical protein Ct9H300mP16_20010 [Pseudomonadota bacterium]|nr:MAG: hypothetical protein Ct9H300mP16_20010 [Pseudomonadota bacterium]
MNGCCSSRILECEPIATMRNPDSARLLTRCIDCESISPVTVEALSGDAGLIHCTDCGVVFNAAWNLVDEVPNPIDPGAPTAVTTRRPASHEHDGNTRLSKYASRTRRTPAVAQGKRSTACATNPGLAVWTRNLAYQAASRLERRMPPPGRTRVRPGGGPEICGSG